eukprot:Phypoly_transcript_25836.p1 GENE.Phypoly_transcript_25836~~Phypoly_transcript_25836.p1  ORF type:complete len:154 (+),score=8.49 Phypoly_transcript_25836:71-463(+)
MNETIKDIYKKKGIPSLYRTIGSTLTGVAIYRGIYFGAYCSLRQKMGKTGDYFIPRLGLAWATTSMASLASYPIDYLRRRQTITKSNIVEVIKSEFSKAGVKGFFKGAMPSVFTRSITGALTLCLFDTFL